jgi:hypothetical protein
VIQPDLLDHRTHRVAGAALAVLHYGLGVRRVLGQVRGDIATAVSHDHDEPDRICFPGGCQRVPEQGVAADLVQHLGDVGLHPRTFACGEDDDRSRTAHTHVVVLLGCCSPDTGIPLPVAPSHTH